MRALAYRLLNVFTVADNRLSGNPLAVFEDGRGLSDEEMQALARQFNLSETTFLLPPDAPGATARVRIFTPTFEMPFAGHPTLGTAHVVRELMGPGSSVTLQMNVGLVSVTNEGCGWTLRAAREPDTRRPSSSASELAEMLGLPANAIAAEPLWVDTGAEQLVIPLLDANDVAQARPRAELLASRGFSQKRGASMAYVWAPSGPDEIIARFFFLVHGGVVEDPATGSACANLGGYFASTGCPLPVKRTVLQGSEVGRPSRLLLHVTSAKEIFVGGDVVELGRGQIEI